VQLRQQLPLIEDISLNHYLRSLGTRLLVSAPSTDYPYTFLIVNDPQINAFATPGGIIVINSGLIEAAQNESELAAVLSHEISHVTQRHLARYYARSGKWDLGTTLGMIAAIVVSAHNPGVGQAALLGSMAANSSAKLGFTRQHEREADRIGHQILEQAGYDTTAIGRFFERLQARNQRDPAVSAEFLQTHPLPASRIADSFSPRHSGGVKDSQKFQLFKARTIGLTKAANGPSTRANTPNKHYSKAVNLVKHGLASAARKELESLSELWSTLPEVRFVAAETQIESRQYPQAIASLLELADDFPNNPAIIQALAKAYLLNKQPSHAYQLLNRSESLVSQWLPLLKLKADAASRSGHQPQSHETMAKYYSHYGRTTLALEQIEIAQHHSDTTSVTQARLKQLKKELEADEKDRN
jgi:predicted Zn-dependent protease